MHSKTEDSACISTSLAVRKARAHCYVVLLDDEVSASLHQVPCPQRRRHDRQPPLEVESLIFARA
eukprot:14850-Heterococcus_DN1.PRE.2